MRGRDAHRRPLTTAARSLPQAPSAAPPPSRHTRGAERAAPRRREGGTDEDGDPTAPHAPPPKPGSPSSSTHPSVGPPPSRSVLAVAPPRLPKSESAAPRTALPGKHVVRAALPGAVPGAARAREALPCGFPAPRSPLSARRHVAEGLHGAPRPIRRPQLQQTVPCRRQGVPSGRHRGGGMLYRGCFTAAMSHPWGQPVEPSAPSATEQTTVGKGRRSPFPHSMGQPALWRRTPPSAFADMMSLVNDHDITTSLYLAF